GPRPARPRPAAGNLRRLAPARDDRLGRRPPPVGGARRTAAGARHHGRARLLSDRALGPGHPAVPPGTPRPRGLDRAAPAKSPWPVPRWQLLSRGQPQRLRRAGGPPRSGRRPATRALRRAEWVEAFLTLPPRRGPLNLPIYSGSRLFLGPLVASSPHERVYRIGPPYRVTYVFWRQALPSHRLR